MPARDPQRGRPWHGLAVEAVVAALRTDAARGLAPDDAASRRLEHGLNLLPTAGRVRWWSVLLRQFRDALIGILVVAAIIAAAVGETSDAVAILAIIVLNGALGFIQEWKAERALRGLRRMLAPRCLVVRGDREQRIDAGELVPGDLVVLETGDRVPADLRIVEAMRLGIDESVLTGESTSAGKGVDPVPDGAPLAERGSMAWMGTVVTRGRARGVVTDTGPATQFGRIARMTEAIAVDTTPLQGKLARLGRKLGLLALGVSALVALAGWIGGRPALEMFFTAVSLAVAVVPEGLPAVVTITLALGVRAMVRRRALLRRLQAAEALGSATVICTDKTGTLTRNEMTVERLWLAAGAVRAIGIGFDPAGHFEVDGRRLEPRARGDLVALLEAGLRGSHARIRREGGAWHHLGQETEVALVVAAHKAGLEPSSPHPTVTEFPFDSDRKRMTVIEGRPDGLLAHVKGAPEVILERCTRIRDGDAVRALGPRDRAALDESYEAMAGAGLRVLAAIATRDLAATATLDADAVERDLTLLGLVGMSDPPRREVPAALRLARTAGIRVIMITGDAAPTAAAIARRVGLEALVVVSGSELDDMDDETLAARLASDAVFARATPEHKLRIVGVLQARGHVVGMTGDGVNDAPALKQADIGIAMGVRGTDVARGASDMVLTDDNFASIINAVREGRRQYDNIQKFVRYLLSSNTGEVVAILLNILIGGPLILLPVQILWINLVTDGLSAIALGVEPAERDVMDRPPRPPREPILTTGGLAMVAVLGAYIGAVTFWLYHRELVAGGPGSVDAARTMAFTGIVIAEKVNVLNFRSLRQPLGRAGLLTNPWILVAIVAMIALQACAVYVPFLQEMLHTVALAPSDWALMAALALPLLVGGEIVKHRRR